MQTSFLLTLWKAGQLAWINIPSKSCMLALSASAYDAALGATNPGFSSQKIRWWLISCRMMRRTSCSCKETRASSSHYCVAGNLLRKREVDDGVSGRHVDPNSMSIRVLVFVEPGTRRPEMIALHAGGFNKLFGPCNNCWSSTEASKAFVRASWMSEASAFGVRNWDDASTAKEARGEKWRRLRKESIFSVWVEIMLARWVIREGMILGGKLDIANTWSDRKNLRYSRWLDLRWPRLDV